MIDNIFRNIFSKVLCLSGYYKAKKKLKSKCFLKRIQKEDNQKQIEIAEKIMHMPSNLLQSSHDSTDIIVSLTSYGKRLYDTAPYAIYSLFKQTLIPNRICLFLDNTWDDSSLPPLIKKLMASGLEVFYEEDIKSYKKLIPAMKLFPDNIIITVDDDFYYNKDIVRWLIESYNQSDHKTVIGSWACIPTHTNDGKYQPYSMWKRENSINSKTYELSLFGGNGTIYPPHIFDSEICNSSIFMSLAPTADDIWFWVMEKRQDINISVIEGNGYGINTPVNRITSYISKKGESLYYKNEIEGSNDIQLANLIEKYHITT